MPLLPHKKRISIKIKMSILRFVRSVSGLDGLLATMRLRTLPLISVENSKDSLKE